MELTANRQRAGLCAAVASVLLGITSVALLRLFAGIPAVALGLWGLRRLNANRDISSSSSLGPPRLAIAGMVLGGVGCVLGLLEVLSLLLVRVGESSRRMDCSNNLRQLGQAVAHYHDFNRKVYPQATVNETRGAAVIVPWLREPYPNRLSWLVSVQPFLASENKVEVKEEKVVLRKGVTLDNLYAPFHREKTWDAPENEKGLNMPMRGFQCASHPQFNPYQRPALGNYVGMSGLGAEAAELPLGAQGVGFFGYERTLTVRDLVRGQSYTLLATETMMDNGPWAAGGTPTLRPVDPAHKPYVGYQRPFGGMHPGGANLLMVDGSVRFFMARGNPLLLEEMATIEEH